MTGYSYVEYNILGSPFVQIKNMSTFYVLHKIAISKRILDVFSSSFCIDSGYPRHKFRVTTRPILKRRFVNFILHCAPLEGTFKIFDGGKKCLSNGPCIPANRMRNLLY